jgi:hypothetical protein
MVSVLMCFGSNFGSLTNGVERHVLHFSPYQPKYLGVCCRLG